MFPPTRFKTIAACPLALLAMIYRCSLAGPVANITRTPLHLGRVGLRVPMMAVPPPLARVAITWVWFRPMPLLRTTDSGAPDSGHRRVLAPDPPLNMVIRLFDVSISARLFPHLNCIWLGCRTQMALGAIELPGPIRANLVIMAPRSPRQWETLPRGTPLVVVGKVRMRVKVGVSVRE